MKRVSCLLLVLSLAACGGGGGGGATSATPPTTTQPQAKVQQVPTQRALAQQALQTQVSANESVQMAGTGGSTPLSFHRALMASAQRVTAAWRAGARTTMRAAGKLSVTYSACANSSESATVVVSSSEEQIYQRNFYDTACTELHQDMFLDVIASSASAATANGTETDYTASGAVSGYLTLSIQLAGIGTTSPEISLQLSEAPNATAQQTASVGISCGVGSTAVNCGLGAFDRVQSLSQDEGVTMTFGASASSSSTAITVPISGSASGYTGALDTLTLAQGTFPSWTVGGGTLVDSVSFNGQFTFASTTGLTQSASLSMSDVSDDGTVSLSTNGTTISGVIKQTSTGATVAKFNVDLYGNGTITYSNGTTAQIGNWSVIG